MFIFTFSHSQPVVFLKDILLTADKSISKAKSAIVSTIYSFEKRKMSELQKLRRCFDFLDCKTIFYALSFRRRQTLLKSL